MSAEGVLRHESWRPALALVAALVAAQLFAPALIGVMMLAASLACLTIAAERRFDVVSGIIVWALAAVMFGPTGAGCLILAQAVVGFAASAIGARLVAATAVAAIACVYLPGLFPGALWAELAAILAIGAPGLTLARLASGGDRTGGEALRCLAFAPTLFALVIGAAVAGLHGAAAVMALSWLATPLFWLVTAPSRRPGRVMAAVGVLAAGLCAAAAMEAARPWAPAPLAVLAAALAGVAALRVHAPAVARGLLRARTPRRRLNAARPARA
jgi:hypothetical protein